MKNAVSALILTILLVPAVTQAQTLAGGATEAALPTTQPTAKLQWSLGLGVISSPRPYVGTDNKISVIPLIELKYKKLYVQGIQAGYHFIDTETFTFDARAGFVFAGLDPAESPDLAGMQKRNSSIEAGFVFDWKPGKYKLSTSIYTDILGNSNGQQAATDFSRMWIFSRGLWGIQPSVGVVWQSSNMVNYYVGVTPEEAQPGRPVFIGHSAVNFRSAVLAFVHFSPRIRLTGLFRVQRLDDEIYESPIVADRRGFFALLGLTYRFGELPSRPSP